MDWSTLFDIAKYVAPLVTLILGRVWGRKAMARKEIREENKLKLELKETINTLLIELDRAHEVQIQHRQKILELRAIQLEKDVQIEKLKKENVAKAKRIMELETQRSILIHDIDLLLSEIDEGIQNVEAIRTQARLIKRKMENEME